MEYVAERTPNWLNTLKQFFEATPSAAVGEIGLDKGSQGKKVDFTDQRTLFLKLYLIRVLLEAYSMQASGEKSIKVLKR
ncbi:hypothetical protein Prudu_020916 [Prunus dulcis]|uniref:Uncharacterized protein n=1 Tax=Prunus dulcis TaxID=3755 RepID=A0A4Y1RXH1_PRUDU|nr:hypothetical protein Prudu_020916 [Prunus dulcis]